MEMLEGLMEALNKASETVQIQSSSTPVEEEEAAPPAEPQEGEEPSEEVGRLTSNHLFIQGWSGLLKKL